MSNEFFQVTLLCPDGVRRHTPGALFQVECMNRFT